VSNARNELARARRQFDSGGKTLADEGETALLHQLVAIARAGGAGASDLVVPSGDDAAVWRAPAGTGIVLSQDAIVEGEDFLRAWTDPFEVGERAFQVAASDLAGMGSEPRLCMATVCAPTTTEVEDLVALQRGLCAAAAEAGCHVAGGDLSAIAGPLVVDVAVVGCAVPEQALRRDRGRPGDALVVTGELGGAAAGLGILLHGMEAPAGAVERWLGRQLRPRARLAEGIELAARGVRCAGDLSDGLLVDLERIAEASACGAELWLDRVPTDPDLRGVLGDRWPEAALGGGEDFELLAAVPAGLLPGLLGAWPSGLQPLRVVGRLAAAPGLRLLDREGGDPLPLPAVASRHFRRS
jgi:thiamine-monophosphate kinase